jgi:class 3 adenylate cyclase
MRVVRCFAFLDLCGFTEFTETHGDEEAVAVLSQLRVAVRAAAERHGVRVTKWLGDGAMLSGVEASGVIACVLEVRESVSRHGELQLRGGIGHGPVIMFEGDDYIGSVVNVAARLCDGAEPGQLLMTGSVTADIPPGTFARPVRPAAMRGMSELVDAAELLPAA